jgi:hypothetical protein
VTDKELSIMGGTALFPPTIEAIACEEGLALAVNLQLTRCALTSDCPEVINEIKNNCFLKYAIVL